MPVRLPGVLLCSLSTATWLVLLALQSAVLPTVLPAAEPAEPSARPANWSAGVAAVDITPDFPVLLSGFAVRQTESEGVTQPIWAKALAVAEPEGEPAVVVTIDSCGVSLPFVKQLARRLEQKAGLKPERLTVTVTHTHTAPMLTGVLPTLFGKPIPPEHQQHIDRYTADLLDKLEQVTLAALADRQPARLEWGIGTVGFAVNRRQKEGPVDRDLPLLVIRDLQGKPRAIYTNYACHCVTLSNNKISGDWAGFAQDLIQKQHPGTIALMSVGCGAEANPSSGVTGDKVDVAIQQGAQIAAEVQRLLGTPLTPVRGPLEVHSQTIDLALASHPSREEWQRRARQQNYVGYHARVQLERLDRGETLPTKVEYPIRSWTFGDSLAMVFLPGEVVADYSLRLKRELDGLRLWTNGYSNSVPCYIPSERVLKLGSYEGRGAMTYYDLPAPFQPGLEDQIVAVVHQQLDPRFHAAFDTRRMQGPRPLSPQQSLATLHTASGITAELVVAEPLVSDPVAIAFGTAGELWVAEMGDYPGGAGAERGQGGRVRLVRDTDSDGRFDSSTVFLDKIPFPTGVTVWRKGVLVCAAPDILYAEDTDGDDRADVVRKLCSGFGTENFQARVNSLEYGLDNWIHGSCGLFGGTIRCADGRTVKLGDRDFRLNPDTGVLEAATGRTQQGRVRNDWGDWFGCNNSLLCAHYPLADHYLRRNPHVTPPATNLLVPTGKDPNQLYPARTDMQLFKLSGKGHHTTAACGLGIYRDTLLGQEMRGNTFTCEPVNLLIHRLQLTPRDCTFTGQRAPDEQQSEFLTSTDTWFRPVQARTGPDGALWIVDMYRYVIEHPRWIPPAELSKVDPRAGDALGRIYRLRPADQPLRTVPRYDRLSTAELVAALGTSNGSQRDLVSQMLIWNADAAAAPALEQLAASSPLPETRLQALCTLEGLQALTTPSILTALRDAHPGVRRHAVRLAEPRLDTVAELGRVLATMVRDPDPQVRLQLACSLGEWHSAHSGVPLATLALNDPGNVYIAAGVLSSLSTDNIAVVTSLALHGESSPSPCFVERLVVTAATIADPQTLRSLLPAVTHPVSQNRNGTRGAEAKVESLAGWQLSALAGLLRALKQRQIPLEKLTDPAQRQQVLNLLSQARGGLLDEQLSEKQRLAMLPLLGGEPTQQAAEIETLSQLLVPRVAKTLQAAAMATLGQFADDRVADVLLENWRGYSPALRSQALDLLLSRPSWQRKLLAAVERDEVQPAQIDAAHRQRLLTVTDAELRETAARLLAGNINPDRQRVLQEHLSVAKLAGDRERGKAVFAKVCATCHVLEKTGTAVGPDLAALASKSPEFLLQEILDPNRNVDSRYVQYLALTTAGRTFSGLLASESGTSITLKGPEGKQEVLLRSDIDELQSTSKSLMPEGLEKDLNHQNLADLIAFVSATTDPRALAARLLDEATPQKQREAIVANYPALAGELIAAMTAELPIGSPDEYRRIPWIWRVAIACGKRNDVAQLRQLLEVSLPPQEGVLRDWQAVVIGGGLINGITQSGDWPAERFKKVFQEQPGLKARWRQALAQSARMADDVAVRSGTRYDALRMVALDDWQRSGPQLTKYLVKGTSAELQMGAVSGLADIDRNEVTALLLAALEYLPARNRELAVEGLLRTDRRTAALLEALRQKQITSDMLSAAQVQRLRMHTNEQLRAKAAELLP